MMTKSFSTQTLSPIFLDRSNYNILTFNFYSCKNQKIEQKKMFPEDFFGTQNQYITIQTQSQMSNREHPKIINPLLIKCQHPQFNEIKEEICEESVDISKNMSKNKIPLRIVISHDSSIEDISTSGGSNNTPISPMTPIIPEIPTDPKGNNFAFGPIKGKPISNSICSSFNESIDNRNNTDEKKDLCLPFAFTFSHKFNEKQNQTLKTSRINKNSFREKPLQERKRKSASCQKNKEDKNIIKAQRTQRLNSQKKYNPKDSNKNNNYSYLKNNRNNGDKKKENCSHKEIKRNIRSNSNSSYENKKLNSAKKNKERNNIMTVKNILNNNNKAYIRRNNSSDKKELGKNNNNKCFISDYRDKKKDIVHSKIKKEINNIFNNLPENYEKFPELNNKLELFMKNIDDIKDVLIKKKSQDILMRNKQNKGN